MLGDKKAPYKSVNEGSGSPMGNNKGPGLKGKSVNSEPTRSTTAPTPKSLNNGRED